VTGALKRVLVVASAAEVATPEELVQAHQVGRLLGENGITVVTAGAGAGPAGTVASAALEAGGRVVGVILAGTADDRVHPALTERRVAATEEDRDRQLADMADAVLGLAGGFPDLDAAFALWTGLEPGGRELPLGLLDDAGYYSDLLKRASDGTVDRFVRESQRGCLVMAARLTEVLRRLADYRPPETRRTRIAGDEEF
jgi:uncharacterized protein (TIGR00730 family)